MSMIKMTELDLAGKRIFLRVDFNISLHRGTIVSDTRIRATIPSIRAALNQGAKVMVASHLGRPIEGIYNKDLSLFPIVNYLESKLQNIKINLVKDYLEGLKINSNELVILENVRFNKGESQNDQTLSKKYADLCDIFVMDAFGSAHRQHASTYGISKFAPIVCAGPLLCTEIEALSKIMKNPKRPLVAIVGGSKVSTKFDVLNSLAKIADDIIVGGGIANTFIAIQNNIGNSLYEPEFVKAAQFLHDRYHNILIPTDCRTEISLFDNIPAPSKKISEIQDNEKIMDIGDITACKIAKLLKKAKTILWNGPVGVFEKPEFRKGTEIIAKSIAESDAFSVAGGGDTIAAIELFGIKDNISYISTGGGAFLKFIEGKKLPTIAMLEKRAKL